MFEIGEDWTSCYNRMKLKKLSWKNWIWSWKYVFENIVGFKEQMKIYILIFQFYVSLIVIDNGEHKIYDKIEEDKILHKIKKKPL
jgi:hypothetical protein